MSVLLYIHPAFLLLLSSFILRYFRDRNTQLFKVFSITPPLFALIKFCKFETINIIDLSGFKLLPIYYDEHNTVIGITLLICHITATIYAISNKQFNEIIWANIYAAASLFAILANDFITLFSSLELMMIASSAIIFLGGHANSKTTSMRYFIMHLTAGICILSGIILITDSGMAREIHVLSLEIEGSMSSKINIGNMLILVGFLVNIGAPPFSAWITDSYPQAKTSGTVFLSLYTTKVAAYYFLILFPGWKILVPIGLVMSLYGALYAVLENNIRRIICYQTIFQLGLVLIGIGVGTNESLLAAKLLIFSHIIYNTLFMIITGVFIDYSNIEKATEIVEVRINTKPLIIGGFIGLISLISFPYSGPFFAKSILGESIFKFNHIIYFVYLALSSLIILSIPWKQLLNANYFNDKNISNTAQFSIYSISIICMLSGIASLIILNLDHKFEFSASLIANQLLLNFAAIFLGVVLAGKEHKTKNLLLTFDYFYRTLPLSQLKQISFQDNQELWKNLQVARGFINLRVRKISDKARGLSHSLIIITFGLSILIAYLTRVYV